MFVRSSLVCLVAGCLAAALDLRGKIEWTALCPNYTTLGHAKAILDNGRLSGGVRSDGHFTIPDVREGTYVLSVLSHDFLFDKLRISVAPSSQTPHITAYVPGTPLNPPAPLLSHNQAPPVPPTSLPYPISLVPRVQNVYFVEHQSFSVLAMFQNPMMMTMGVVGILMLGMPYLLKNLDPELQQEFSERHAKLQSIQASMQAGDLKSGFAALIADDGASPSVPKKSNPSSGPSAGSSKSKGVGGKGKRR